jgi:bifunctional aspartokinase / homoserine dehydrogenase 1
MAAQLGPNQQAREAPPVERWRVHKFGGSSVADAVCMERVAKILEQDPQPRLGVVLSACRGITDALLNLVSAAERQGKDIAERIEQIRSRHQVIADTLLKDEARTQFLATLNQDLKDIQGILQTVQLIRSAPQTVRDLIAGYGEIWSTRLFSAYLRARGLRPGKVEWIDARHHRLHRT